MAKILIGIGMCILIIMGIILFVMNINHVYGEEREKHSLQNYRDIQVKMGKVPTKYYNPCHKKFMDLMLRDFFVASSYCPYMIAGNTNDIISYKGVEECIRVGARFHYLKVTSSDEINIYNERADPILKLDKMMKKYSHVLYFKKICEIYGQQCWKHTNYPFILYLEFDKSVYENKFLLYKIYTILYNSFHGRFLDKTYSFQRKNIGTCMLKECWNRVVLICNVKPIQGDLDELMNGLINEKNNQSGTILKYHHSLNNYGGIKGRFTDTESLKNFHRTHLGILIPEDTQSITNFIEPGIDLTDVPINAQELGFQFICIHYQKKSKYREEYISFFQHASFVLKPDSLRFISCPKPILKKQSTKGSYAPKSINFKDGFFKHPI